MEVKEPCPEAPRAESHEDGADEFAKRGCIDRVQFLLLAVTQVVVVQGAAGQAHPLRRLVVVQQPLQLKTDRKDTEPHRVQVRPKK